MRHRRLALLLLSGVVVLAVNGCGDTDGTQPTTSAEPSSIPATTSPPRTTTSAMPATSTATTVTTTPDPTGIFDDAALDALIASIVAELNVDLGPIPVPDLINPDPLVAMQELNAFSDWVHTTYPHPAWAQVLTVADAPGRRSWDSALTRIFGDGARFVFLDDGWTWTNYELEPDVGVSAAFLTQVPENAVIVRYEQEFGDYEIRSLADDEVVAAFEGRGVTRIDLALVPTEFGWQIWGEA